MKMDLTYRDAPLPADAGRVEALLEKTGMFRRDEIAVALELIGERLAKGAASGYHFWFADRAASPHCPAGYVCYGPTPCTIGSFDLYWIAVDEACQGRGLGRVLAELAESSATKMKGRRMYVETSGKKQYEPTRAFYRALGYAEAARLPDFYDAGDDKIIFQKTL